MIKFFIEFTKLKLIVADVRQKICSLQYFNLYNSYSWLVLCFAIQLTKEILLYCYIQIIQVQTDQINMTVCIWYLVKSDLSSVRHCTSVTGHPVYNKY